MKHFLLTICSFFTVSAVVFIGYYVAYDPFMMVWHYDDYLYSSGAKQCLNGAYQGMRGLEQNDSTPYNAFIVGSSRSLAFYHAEWKKHIGQDAYTYTWYQSDGNLWGNLQRIRYACQHYDVQHLLLVMDEEALCNISENSGALFHEPWQITDCPFLHFFIFQWDMLKSFYSVKFQQSILLSQPLSGGQMRHTHLMQTGEIWYSEADSIITFYGHDAYVARLNPNPFYTRDSVETIDSPQIDDHHLCLLQQLKSILEEEGTDYRIVLGPLYSQIKINPTDYQILLDLFGTNRVFDFSGKNSITDDSSNYYENSHYTASVANQIMDVLYQ